MKKRIISLLLALVMLFGVLPVTALADGGEDVAEQPATVETKDEEVKEEPKEEEKEVGESTPPNSQNKVIESSDEEEEDTEDEDETNEVSMLAAPEQVVTYSTDEDRDGKYLIFSRAQGTYVMAAKTNAQLEDTLKSSADPSLYKFTLEKLNKTIPIDNVSYHVYHVSITINNTKYYLTTNGNSGTIGIKNNSNQAAEFLICRADVYAAQGGGKLDETRLCLFHVAYNDSNTAYGEAVEYETTHQSEHPGQGSYTLKLCSQNTANYGQNEGWDVCVDAYNLETENAIVTPKTAKVTVTKVFSNMDAADIPTNFEVKLVSTSKTYKLTREGTSGYTYSATVEEGSYRVEEDKFTNDNYHHLSTKLEEEVSGSKTEIQPNQGEFNIEVNENENRTFTLTNTYTKKADPKATSASKEVVCDSLPRGVTLPEGVTVTYPKTENNTIQPILIEEDTTSVTLLYKITVTGQVGADFTVTDTGSAWAFGTVNHETEGTYTGTLTDTTLVFYVTKTFQSSDFSQDTGYLTNNVSLTGGDGDEEKVPYEKKALVTITKDFTGDLTPQQQPTVTIKLIGSDSNEYTLTKSTSTLVYSGRVPAGTYTVSEGDTANVEHYDLTATLKNSQNDEIANKQITVANGETYIYTLKNHYTKQNVRPYEFDLSNLIVKTLTGGELPENTTFRVNVTKKVDGGEDVTKNGETTSKKQFTNDAFSFGNDNIFKLSETTEFEVTEVKPTPSIDGLTYDSNIYILKVELEKNDAENKMTLKSLTYTIKDKAEDNDPVTVSTSAPLVISNKYKAPITTGSVMITKVVEGGFTLPSNFGIKLVPTEEGKDEVTLNLKSGTTDKYEATDVPAGEYTVVEFNHTDSKYTLVSRLDGTDNFKITVAAKSEQSHTLTNTYKKIEKTPASFDFSDLIQKELTIKGDYKFEGETFYARLRMTAYRDNSIAKLSSALVPVDGASEAYTLTATFGENARWSGSTEDFEGETLYFPKAGTYRFRLHEKNEDKSGVTYDESVYVIYVVVKEATGNKLVIDTISCLKYANEDKLKNNEPESSTYTVLYKEGELTGKTITFYNTVNTGYKSNDHIKIDSPNKLNTDDHYAYIIGYPDGTVQPNGEITRAEVATIFFRLLKDDVREKYFTKTNDFSDVSRDDWFNNPVSTMAELGIVKGYPDGTFRPNEPITRAEFAAIAARFDESTRYGETRFTDVAGHWAIREIAKAYNNGWIKGYPDNTFRPNRNITRAEAMTLINRVLNRAPETEKDLLSNMNKWSDNMDVDAWYYLAVQEATNSHDYRRKSSSYEHWIRMLEDPNWAKYER